MQMYKGFSAVAGAVLLLSMPVLAGAAEKYKEVPVSNGGTISGKINFKGTPPPPKEFDLAKFPQPDFCGQVDNDGKGHRLLHEVTVTGGLLGDVVVYIEEVEQGKPFKQEPTQVVANKCRFLVQQGSDFVGVVINKGELDVTNQDADPSDPKSADGVLHNPHGYEVLGPSSSTLFNKPLPTKGQTVKLDVKLRKAKKGSQMKMECDQHNFMNVHFIPVDNPYYAVIGKSGKYTIDQIPPGEYEVYAWHPILGKVEKKVKVVAGGTAAIDFDFSDE